MEIRIVEGSVIEHAARMQPLLEQHVEELTTRKDLMVLDPDWAKYQALEAAGIVLALFAWAGDELIGYSVTFIGPHLHYKQLRYAHNDVLFLAQNYRGAPRVGMQLIAETERLAKERGARLMTWHAKQGTALDSLLRREGYAVQDILYTREL